MALDPGVSKCVWEIGEWDKKKEIKIDNARVRMALVIKTLEMRPHVEIVDMRPDTIYLVWPSREGDRKWFTVEVAKAYGLPPKKTKRW